MNVAGADRNRQLLTVGIGAILALMMAFTLIFGFRLATQMRASVQGLQTASMLQTYPDAITQQLNSLRDRLEARAYAGQALADLKATVKKFDHAAINAVKHWHYEPVVANGVPVEVPVRTAIRFELPSQ